MGEAYEIAETIAPAAFGLDGSFTSFHDCAAWVRRVCKDLSYQMIDNVAECLMNIQVKRTIGCEEERIAAEILENLNDPTWGMF